jgi:hypothetical protein
MKGDFSLYRKMADPFRKNKSFFCQSKVIRRFLIPPAEAGSIRNDIFFLWEKGERAGGMTGAFRLLFPPFNPNTSCHSEQSEESPSQSINLYNVIPSKARYLLKFA